MAFLNATYRKNQFLVNTRQSVHVNSGANSPNFSLSLTGPLFNLPEVAADQIIIIHASFQDSHMGGVINPTMSDGYIYASVLASKVGGVATDSAESPFLISLLIGSRPV